MSIKKSFKIFLDSNNTDSWNGNLYRANYYIDLNQIIILLVFQIRSFVVMI